MFDKIKMNEFSYKGKYKKELVIKTLSLLKKGVEIRKIAKEMGVPETTIRNWKFGYTRIYGKNNYLCENSKGKILNLIKKGIPIHIITQKLYLNYDLVRIFVKNNLSEREYGEIKWSQRLLPKRSKKLDPNLAYILGVLYGDGYFGKCQINLGTSDEEFRDYFAKILYYWSGKKPACTKRLMKGKPYYTCLLSFKDAKIYVLSLIGDRSSIPQILLNSTNKKIISNFIKGFADSEGSIVIAKRTKMLKVSNQNMLLLKQCRDLMVMLGFSMQRIKIRLNNKAPNGNVYEIILSAREELQKFHNLIGFTIQRKNHKLEQFLKNG
jgi:intein-encoded DNA endonuclease-like protein